MRPTGGPSLPRSLLCRQGLQILELSSLVAFVCRFNGAFSLEHAHDAADPMCLTQTHGTRNGLGCSICAFIWALVSLFCLCSLFYRFYMTGRLALFG